MADHLRRPSPTGTNTMGSYSRHEEGMYDYPGSTPAPSYHAHAGDPSGSSSRFDLAYPEDDDHFAETRRHRAPAAYPAPPASVSELAPDDSVSVVADRIAGVPRFRGDGTNGGGWRYQDPYADVYSGSRRPPESAFSSATRRGEKGETIRQTPESPDWDPETPLHHGGGAFDSMASLPLVGTDEKGRRGPFDPLEDDDGTIVGSAYHNGKFRPASTGYEGESRDALNTVPYRSIDGSDDAAAVRRSMQPPTDEETKYPPLVSGIESLADINARRPPVWQRLFYDSTSLEDKIELHKRGIGVQARPWMCWILGLGMVAGLIAELVRNVSMTLFGDEGRTEHGHSGKSKGGRSPRHRPSTT